MTLASIGPAILNALKTLGPAAGGGTGDFAIVDWFAGEISQSGVDQETLGHTPASFLTLESDDPRESEVKRLGGETASYADAVWRVYLVVQDLRGEAEAMAGMSGMLRLLDKVLGKLNRLPVSGIVGDGELEYLGARPALIQRGVVYVYLLRFAALRVTESVAPTDASVPLAGITGNVDLVGHPDGVVENFDTIDIPTSTP